MATITTEAMAGATVTVVEVAALVVVVVVLGEVDVKSLALPNFYFLTDF